MIYKNIYKINDYHTAFSTSKSHLVVGMIAQVIRLT